MGTKILMLVDQENDTWNPGTILGVHDGVFDILLSNGEGKMNVASSDLRPDENAVEETAPKKTSAAPKSTIGWNPGAFGDEEEEVVDDDESEVSERSAPVQKTFVKKTGGSKEETFEIGDKVDIKDYVTKSYRPAKLTALDAELGTYSAIYEDTGDTGTGIPYGLCRARKDRSKKEKKSKSKQPAATATAGGNSTTINDINAILTTLSEKDLTATLEIVKQIQRIAQK